MTRIRVVAGLLLAVALGVWCCHGVAAVVEGGTTTSKSLEQSTDEVTSGTPDGAAEEGGADNNILWPKTDLALWTAVVFLVLLVILWRFAWGPIRRGLELREKGIADQIAEAQASNRQAQTLLEKYQQQLAQSKDEVRTILDQARRDAEQTGREMLERAKQEASAERQRALQQIDVATGNALKELAEEGADLAVRLAGKIVRAELKPKDHADLIRRTVSDLAGRVPSEN